MSADGEVSMKKKRDEISHSRYQEKFLLVLEILIKCF